MEGTDIKTILGRAADLAGWARDAPVGVTVRSSPRPTIRASRAIGTLPSSALICSAILRSETRVALLQMAQTVIDYRAIFPQPTRHGIQPKKLGVVTRRRRHDG